MDDRVTYLCVGRDPRDAAISMFHHVANVDFEVGGGLIREVVVADGLEMPTLPADPPPATAEAYFWHWIDDPTPATQNHASLVSTLHHYELALSAASQSNVVVLHYGDLQRDLENEMRRLADRLQMTVPESKWPTLLQAASFEHMRAHADELAPNAEQHLWKDTAQFFRSGTGGHWRDFFDEAAQRRYEARVAELASPAVAAWAHSGQAEWQAGRQGTGA
jgi:hypothetical protein